MKKFALALALLLIPSITFGDQKLVDKLQSTSVTVKSAMGQGSGTLFTRGDTTFVWTAGHVIEHLRHERDLIDGATGTHKTVVEFDDAAVVQEFKEDGRRIGEIKMDAKVVRYSGPQDGEDLALLQIRKKNFTTLSCEFYLDEEIPTIGTELYHVGSLLGQFGSNSLTSGIISQVGRTLDVGGTVFDQTTATAFPGSSGGGVYLKADGRYVGMLVRGAGEGFNFIVPVRRLHQWAKDAKIEWAVDQKVEMPSAAELKKLPIEDSGVVFAPGSSNGCKPNYLEVIYGETPFGFGAIMADGTIGPPAPAAISSH